MKKYIELKKNRNLQSGATDLQLQFIQVLDRAPGRGRRGADLALLDWLLHFRQDVVVFVTLIHTHSC